MPAKSRTQQQLFGWVHSIKKDPSKRKDAPKKILEIVDSIKGKDAEELASTSHKGLPEKIKPKKEKKKKKRKGRKKKSKLIIDLVKIANTLDSMNCTREADLLDLYLESLNL